MITLDVSFRPETSEAEGVTPIYMRDAMQVTKLPFRGVKGFNSAVAFKMLEFLADSAGTQRAANAFKILMAWDEPKGIPWNCVGICSTSATRYAFQTLSTLGVNLNELFVMYREKDGKLQMMVPGRLATYLSKIPAEDAAQLALSVYCTARIHFMALKQGDFLPARANGGMLSVEGSRFDAFAESYNAFFKESVKMDVGALDDNADMTDVIYPCSSVLQMSGVIPEPAPKGMIYNSVKLPGGTLMCLTNCAFSPKEHYMISSDSTIVYTNASDFKLGVLRYVGSFIYRLASTIESNTGRSVGFRRLDAKAFMRTKEKSAELSADVAQFEYVFDKFQDIQENYDLKVYDGLFEGTSVSMEGNSGIEGDYSGDEFAQELLKQNVPYYDEFDLGAVAPLVKAIGKGTVYAAMFEGEAGTGKSTAARVICYRCGLPWVSVNLSLNVDESDLFGAMMPNPEKKDANDPEFVWRDGLITKAIRNGYGAILEEVNAARPGVLMKLNALLDDSRQIELSNGELVKAHPNFRLIATCNIGYEGTNRMNKAFVDRFDVCHMFEAPDKTSAVGIVKTRTGYTDMAKIEKAYAAYEAVRKYSNEQRLGLTVSIRRLIAMFKGGRCYKSAKDAFVACVVDPAFLECPDQRKYFMENVLTAYDLSYKL